MNHKKTMLFFFIFAFIGTYYYLIEIKQAAKTKKIEQEIKKVFYPVKKEEISEITLEKNNTTIRIVKKNNTWKIKKPVEANVDKNTFGTWLDNVAKLKKERVIATSVENKSEFGLDNPSFTLQIKTSNESVITLESGDEIPTGGMFYAKQKNKDTIFLVAVYNINGIDKNAYELRDKSIIRFDKNSINKIKLISPDKIITVIKDKKNNWEIIEPKKSKADNFEVNSILNNISVNNIIDFISKNEGEENAFALKNSKLSVKLFKQGDNTPKTISFGGYNKSKDAVYADIGIPDEVVLIKNELFSKLNVNEITLRYKNLLVIDEDKTRHIQINTKGKEYLLSKTKDTWSLEKPEKKTSGIVEAKELIWKLEDIKFTDIADEGGNANLADFGLQNPAIKVTLLDANKNKLKSLFIGTKIKDVDTLFAMTDKSKTIYSIGQKFSDNLLNGIEVLLATK